MKLVGLNRVRQDKRDVGEFLDECKEIYSECAVLGYDKESMMSFSNSGLSVEEAITLIETIKYQLLAGMITPADEK